METPINEIRQLREGQLQRSRSVLARLLKVSENTIFRWETGKVKPDPQSREKLDFLRQLCDLLGPTITGTPIVEWLQKQLTTLDNFRPIDLIESEYGRRQLLHLAERLGKEPRPGLAERRAVLEYEKSDFPQDLLEIHSAAGFDVPVYVHWNVLAARYAGRVDQISGVFKTKYIQPLLTGLRAVAVDDLGKDALRRGLKHIELAGEESFLIRMLAGVLKMGIYASSFNPEKDHYALEIQKQLEGGV